MSLWFRNLWCFLAHGRYWIYSPLCPYAWQVYCPKCGHKWTQFDEPSPRWF